MTELIVLAVIGVGLYRRGGRSFEWSRRSVRAAVADAAVAGRGWLGRALRASPAVAGQCLIDMRALFDDTLGLIDPKYRRRVQEHARNVMARAERAQSLASGAAAGLVTAGQPGLAPYAALQKSYLEGAISLERYMEEAERLRRPG